MAGNALCMVASRDGNHTACAFLRGQQGQLVGRPAFLERADSLQIFQLERNFCPRCAGESVGGQCGCADYLATNTLGCGGHIFERDHVR